MKRTSLVLAVVALSACAGDRAVAPAAPAPAPPVRIIRGIAADKAPLVFLDGKEISATDMQAIDRKSILRVEVIKGSKAMETYGERAANGVIFIDSKR